MLERVLLLLGLAALFVLAVLLTRWWARARRERLAAGSPGPLWEVLGAAPDGRPTVVAFSTPSCGACRTAQAPALEALERQLGAERVRVLRVDASDRPEVARTFGVLTVPSTVVLAGNGRVAAVNHGFAPLARLEAQLQPA